MSIEPITQENTVKPASAVINSTTQNTEEERRCTAIIWLKNDSNNKAKSAIANTLQTIHGVSDVTYVRKKPCIMMVDYCRDKVQAHTIVGAVNIHGGVARIIGC